MMYKSPRLRIFALISHGSDTKTLLFALRQLSPVNVRNRVGKQAGHLKLRSSDKMNEQRSR